MAKKTKRRRYACEAGFLSKRDALAEAAGIRSIPGISKVTVKKRADSYAVCRTYAPKMGGAKRKARR